MARKENSKVPAYLEGLVKKSRDGWYFRTEAGPKYPWIGPFETEEMAVQVRETTTGSGEQPAILIIAALGSPHRAHATIGSGESTTRASFSTKIKQAIRDLYGLKVKMRTNQTKSPFIEAWIPWEGNQPPSIHFPADLRNAALDVNYGQSFARDRSNPNAGNVRAHSIALKGPQWVETFRYLGHEL